MCCSSACTIPSVVFILLYAPLEVGASQTLTSDLLSWEYHADGVGCYGNPGPRGAFNTMNLGRLEQTELLGFSGCLYTGTVLSARPHTHGRRLSWRQPRRHPRRLLLILIIGARCRAQAAVRFLAGGRGRYRRRHHQESHSPPQATCSVSGIPCHATRGATEPWKWDNFLMKIIAPLIGSCVGCAPDAKVRGCGQGALRRAEQRSPCRSQRSKCQQMAFLSISMK